MANLFPPMDLTPAPMQGYYGSRMLEEKANQAAMESELAKIRNQQQQLQLEEARAQQPVSALQRQATTGTLRGQIERQPYVNQRELKVSKGAAARAPMDIQGADLESQAKVRTAQMKQEADMNDMFVQAWGPMLRAQAAGDYEGANQGWQDAFEYMKKHKIPGIENLEIMPREELLPDIRKRYSRALNDAKTIRERIKADEASARRIKEIQAQERARISALRKDAEKHPATPNAVVARHMNAYAKGEDLTADQQSVLRDYLEGNIRENREVYDSILQAASQQEAQVERNMSPENDKLSNPELQEPPNEQMPLFRNP